MPTFPSPGLGAALSRRGAPPLCRAGTRPRGRPRPGRRRRRPAPAPPRPAKFKSTGRQLGPVRANKVSIPPVGYFIRLWRSPPQLQRPRLPSLSPSGQGPLHAQPGAARPPAARSLGRFGPAPKLRPLSGARVPAPLRRLRHTPRSRTPRVLLLRRGHPSQARPPRARRLPGARLRQRRPGPLDRSLSVSGPGAALGTPGDVAASLPEAPCVWAPRGPLLRPPGLRRPRYEVPSRPRPGKWAGRLCSV